MRTIKFRGKASYNGEWLFGYLINICGNYHILGKDDMREDGHHVAQDSDRPTWVNPETVGQFTGLTDRNGEEIYEGDILAIEGIKYPRHYIVSWNTEKLMFCVGDTPLYALLEAGSTTIREYSVCGNVHDNHKLLKDEKD